MSFSQNRAAESVAELQVGEVNYEFTEVELPSGNQIALGIEKDKYGDFVNISVRDLFVLRALQQHINTGTYKVVRPIYTTVNPLNNTTQLTECNTITIVESQMKSNHKMIAIAKPEVNGQQGQLPRLSEDDIMFLFDYLSS